MGFTNVQDVGVQTIGDIVVLVQVLFEHSEEKVGKSEKGEFLACLRAIVNKLPQIAEVVFYGHSHCSSRGTVSSGTSADCRSLGHQ